MEVGERTVGLVTGDAGDVAPDGALSASVYTFVRARTCNSVYSNQMPWSFLTMYVITLSP